MRLTSEVTGVTSVKSLLKDLAPKEAKNLLRATVQDIAKQLASDGKVNAPVDEGDLKKGIKPKRERGSKTSVASTVRAAPFYWRYLERGQGPDGVEHAMFMKALEKMRPDLDRVYLQTFVKKYEAAMARKRKKAA